VMLWEMRCALFFRAANVPIIVRRTVWLPNSNSIIWSPPKVMIRTCLSKRSREPEQRRWLRRARIIVSNENTIAIYIVNDIWSNALSVKSNITAAFLRDSRNCQRTI
jgi:hypothetical protein